MIATTEQAMEIIKMQYMGAPARHIEKLLALLAAGLSEKFDNYDVEIIDASRRPMVVTDDDDNGEEIRPWVEGAITDIWADMEAWIVEV